MLSILKVSTEEFVLEVIRGKAIGSFVAELDLDENMVLEKIVQHFSDMGIYEVAPYRDEKIMINTIITFLKYSPEITSKVNEIRERKQELAMRKQRKTGGSE